MCAVKMQAPHLELNFEPAAHLRPDAFLYVTRKISVKQAKVRHEGRLAPMAEGLASGLVRFPQGLRERHVNEKAAKVLIPEIDILQPDGERPQRGGETRGLAGGLSARSSAAAQQRYVRGEFQSAEPGT